MKWVGGWDEDAEEDEDVEGDADDESGEGEEKTGHDDIGTSSLLEVRRPLDILPEGEEGTAEANSGALAIAGSPEPEMLGMQ